MSSQPKMGEPTDAEIAAFLEGGGEDWGRITMAHLQEYKARQTALAGEDTEG